MLRNASARARGGPEAVQVAETEKAPYQTPTLTRLGSVVDLTGGGPTGSQKDAIKLHKKGH
jgi:hypothetical protein